MVSIIIPTTCQRLAELRRAIESIATQGEVDIIIVVNGRFDHDLTNCLKADRRLSVYYRSEGNVSAARHYGVQQVKTKYFGFLDDDDELLPNALITKVALMEAAPSIDVLVTNGYIHERSDVLLVKPGIKINSRPMEAFLEGNWFASPAPLFRSSTVSSEAFAFTYRFYEWAYLFFALLISGKLIHYSEAVTYRKYEDTDVQVSKSEQYQLALPSFQKVLLTMPLPSKIRAALRRKYHTALNANSQIYLRKRDLRNAITCHIKCLFSGGWRYAAYTRKLVTALFT